MLWKPSEDKSFRKQVTTESVLLRGYVRRGLRYDKFGNVQSICDLDKSSFRRVLGQRPDWSGLGARDTRNELWMSLLRFL